MSIPPPSDPPTRTLGPVLIGMGVLVLCLTRTIPNEALGNNADPGPRTFPIATASILLAGGLYELIRYFAGRRRLACHASTRPPTASPPAADNIQALFLIIGLVVYLLAMPWLGFPTATLVFSIALMLRLGAGKAMAATASAGLVLAIYLLFVLLFKVQLPPGVLGLSW